MSDITPEGRAAKVYEAMGLTCNDGPDWVEWTFRISQQIREAVEIALKNAGDCDGCGVEILPMANVLQGILPSQVKSPGDEQP